MDQERYDKDSKIYHTFKRPTDEGEYFNYRLLSKEEVPKWVTAVKKKTKEDE